MFIKATGDGMKSTQDAHTSFVKSSDVRFKRIEDAHADFASSASERFGQVEQKVENLEAGHSRQGRRLTQNSDAIIDA